ncbi:MAG: alkaline phosphatase family protein [Actinomycetota bacterium]
MRRRVLVVGWDGADWEIVDDLLARGLLPNLEALIREGGRGTLLSTVPSHSWAAWSSFLTGSHPAGHGVWDFVQRDPTDADRRIPVSSTSIRQATFLDRLSAAGLEVRAANIPVTFPPWEVNGRMIGGVAIPRGAPFVTPSAFAEELGARAPFPINGLEWMHHRDAPESLVGDALRLVEQRSASFEILLEGRWDVAVCVFVAPDRVQHAMGAYLLPTHPAHAGLRQTQVGESLRSMYALLDEALARLHRAAGPDALTIVMSDHGFRPIAHLAGTGKMLEALGFASSGSRARLGRSLRRWAPTRALGKTRAGYRLKQRVRAPAALDWSRTAAYSAGSGGAIAINLEGREIHGTVDPGDYDRVRREVAGALLAFRDPQSGEAPVAQVTFREELPAGPHLDLAPDLLARPAPGWGLGNIDHVTQPSTWPSGDHRREGIIVCSDAAAADLGTPSIVDLAPTLLSLQGLRADDIDGRPIPAIAGTGGDLADAASPTPGDGLGRSEEDEIARHLRGLGYIE